MPKQQNESAKSSSASRSQEEGAAFADGTLTLRITEEPLTAHNVAIVFSALTDLYIKLRFLDAGVLAQLAYFTQTHDPSYYTSIPLTISSLTQNSPVRIVLSVGPAIGKALESIIDAIALTPARMTAAKMANEQARQSMELGWAEWVARSARQKAETELARKQLQVDYERSLVQLQRERLELQAHRFDLTLEYAQKATEMLAPNLAPAARDMVVQNLLPELLQLGNADGLVVDRDHPRRLA